MGVARSCSDLLYGRKQHQFFAFSVGYFYVRRLQVVVKLQRPARENVLVLLKAYTWVLVCTQRNRGVPCPEEVLVSVKEGKPSAETWGN